MFAIDCPRHRARVLLWPCDITSLTTTPLGIEVHWHCTCGAEGVHLTGRARVPIGT